MPANEAAYGVLDNCAQDTHRATDAERAAGLPGSPPSYHRMQSHGLVALGRDRAHDAALAVIVVERVVLGAAVVPDRQGARFPAETAGASRSAKRGARQQVMHEASRQSDRLHLQNGQWEARRADAYEAGLSDAESR